MQVNFYATYRQIVGGKAVDLPIPESITVRHLVDEIVRHYPKLRMELLDENGEPRRYVHVFVNGRDALHLAAGFDTRLEPDDTVNIFPPIAGGAD